MVDCLLCCRRAARLFAVSEIYLGRSITIAESFRRVSGELLSLFGVVMLNGLATFAGLRVPVSFPAST